MLLGLFLFLLHNVIGTSPSWLTNNYNLPTDFVYAKDLVPHLVEEIRYAGYHNFIGRPVASYLAPKCILTRQAAIQLAQVAQDLLALWPQAYTLKAYDCYRPQTAVDDFVHWSLNLTDLLMRAEFYPHVPKDALFRDGYIASRSGHSRGSTIDLTIVPYPVPGQETYQYVSFFAQLFHLYLRS
jgi:D-alanyl-D-alanine dipeptidase